MSKLRIESGWILTKEYCVSTRSLKKIRPTLRLVDDLADAFISAAKLDRTNIDIVAWARRFAAEDAAGLVGVLEKYMSKRIRRSARRRRSRHRRHRRQTTYESCQWATTSRRPTGGTGRRG
jgi:hypothetical protein